MPIKYVTKDVTTVTHGVVAHGTNCKGLMGSGVAFAIRRKWKKAYNDYNELCKNYTMNTKELLGMTQIVRVTDDITVANCFTQDTCGSDGKVYADIDAVIESIENVLAYANLHDLPVYLPKIGCGLGGLNYEVDVKHKLEVLSAEYGLVDVYVCDI
jgi:O-acetyl-ADP-ribose deacetylase (regulator of RNase III)